MKVFLCLSFVLLLATYVNSYSYQQQQQQSYSQPSYNSKSQSYDNKNSYSKPSRYSDKYDQKQYQSTCLEGQFSKEIITSPGSSEGCSAKHECVSACNAACIGAGFDYASDGDCVHKKSNTYSKKQSYSKRSASYGQESNKMTTACKCCCAKFPYCPTSLSSYQLPAALCTVATASTICEPACAAVPNCGTSGPSYCVQTTQSDSCQCCCQPCQRVTTPSDSYLTVISPTTDDITNNEWYIEGGIYTQASGSSPSFYTYKVCSQLPVEFDFTDLYCAVDSYNIAINGGTPTQVDPTQVQPCSGATTFPNPPYTPEDDFTDSYHAHRRFYLAPGTNTITVTLNPPPLGDNNYASGYAIRFTVLPGTICPGGVAPCPSSS